MNVGGCASSARRGVRNYGRAAGTRHRYGADQGHDDGGRRCGQDLSGAAAHPHPTGRGPKGGAGTQDRAAWAGYRDAQFVAAKFSGLDERELKAWAQGLALGEGILDAEWPTERFLAEQRRSLSHIAALAEGARMEVGARIEVVRFILTRPMMCGTTVQHDASGVST